MYVYVCIYILRVHPVTKSTSFLVTVTCSQHRWVKGALCA